MSFRLARLLSLTVLALAALACDVRAQSPAPPVCRCGAAAYPHYHPATRAGGGGYRTGPGGTAPGAAGPVTGLPRGRRYYGGRFFGSFNNRYYSPQYGYF